MNNSMNNNINNSIISNIPNYIKYEYNTNRYLYKNIFERDKIKNCFNIFFPLKIRTIGENSKEFNSTPTTKSISKIKNSDIQIDKIKNKSPNNIIRLDNRLGNIKSNPPNFNIRNNIYLIYNKGINDTSPNYRNYINRHINLKQNINLSNYNKKMNNKNYLSFKNNINKGIISYNIFLFKSAIN